MLIFTLALALALAQVSTAPPGGPVTPASGRYHLVRSLSGTKGAPERDRFVFEDQRSVFQAGVDRQVLVLFEWEGPLGVHQCEGRWKDPSGRVVLTSQNEVVARSARFGVYWGLSLSDAVTAGTWVVEAFVDGEPVGAHAFQIVAGATGAPGTPARRSLSLTELYQRGLATTLTIEALDPAGVVQRRGSAMWAGPGLVQSTFAMINAARRLRVATQDGRHVDTTEVVSWDSGEDRATLRLAGVSGPRVDLAREPAAVGDRLFFLDASEDGTRVIIDSAAVGRSPAGDLVLGQPASDAAEGAPVFNDYGEVVATIMGSGLLGASVLDEYALERPLRIGPSQSTSAAGGRARPVTTLPDPQAPSKTLLELEQAGAFVKPVARTDHFVSGVMGTGIEKQNGIPFAVGQGFRFSRGERSCIVFTTWRGRRKQDATSALELYDGANRRIWVSNTETVKLRRDQTQVRYWTLALTRLPPGVYRVEVTLGPDPVWRTFFRVTE